MKSRLITVLAVLMLVVVACKSGDAELSTESTIVTGGTNAPATTTTTGSSVGEGSEGSTTQTTLVGEAVAGWEVVNTIPNDNGEERWYVIPDGAYTDVDLENFVVDLIDADGQLYGAEIFKSAEAAEAFAVAPDQRTETQVAIIESDHFVTLVGRESIEYHGPFAEFSGGAIGS